MCHSLARQTPKKDAHKAESWRFFIHEKSHIHPAAKLHKECFHQRTGLSRDIRKLIKFTSRDKGQRHDGCRSSFRWREKFLFPFFSSSFSSVRQSWRKVFVIFSSVFPFSIFITPREFLFNSLLLLLQPFLHLSYTHLACRHSPFIAISRSEILATSIKLLLEVSSEISTTEE